MEAEDCGPVNRLTISEWLGMLSERGNLGSDTFDGL
jgi:hypothetical protein